MSEAAAPKPSAAIPGLSRLMPDRRLAERASRGDERAFAAIYERHGQALYRYCLAILGNPQDAQDALQGTMEKALSSLPGENREIELKPWLFRIAHNVSIDPIRRRRGTVELDPESIFDGPALATEAEARERLRNLIADLGELPERQRGALVMRELSGLDFDQIAAALGTSAAVARQTLYEARLGLRQAEEGREMSCEEITRALSGGDGRVARRRDIRAHLRTCASCRRFDDEISERSRDFAALTPLPALAATGILSGILGGSGGGGAGVGALGALGGGAAKTAGVGAALKATAAVAVVAAVGTVAVDRGGLVDAGVPGGAGSSSREAPAGEPPAAGAAAAAATSGEGAAIERRVRAEARARARARAVGPAGARGPASERPDRADAGGGPGEQGRGLARGREGELPAASSHGQQTAAAHKQSGKGRSSHPTKPAHPAHPAKPPKPVAPPKPPKPVQAEGGGGSGKAVAPPAPTEPPAEPPAGAGSGGSEPGKSSGELAE